MIATLAPLLFFCLLEVPYYQYMKSVTYEAGERSAFAAARQLNIATLSTGTLQFDEARAKSAMYQIWMENFNVKKWGSDGGRSFQQSPNLQLTFFPSNAPSFLWTAPTGDIYHVSPGSVALSTTSTPIPLLFPFTIPLKHIHFVRAVLKTTPATSLKDVQWVPYTPPVISSPG